MSVIGFLKKFVNSTIGTSGSKALNEIIVDKSNEIRNNVQSNLNTFKSDINSSLNKLKKQGKFIGQNGKMLQGTISSNLSYLNQYEISGLDSYDEGTMYIEFYNLQCFVVGKTRDGETIFMNPAVRFDTGNRKFIIYFSRTTENLPDTSGSLTYTITWSGIKYYKGD